MGGAARPEAFHKHLGDAAGAVHGKRCGGGARGVLDGVQQALRQNVVVPRGLRRRGRRGQRRGSPPKWLGLACMAF